MAGMVFNTGMQTRRIEIMVVIRTFMILGLGVLPAWTDDRLTEQSWWKDGASTYQNQCVDCHGEQGKGVAGKYDETLYGDRSLESLTQVIIETMPEKHPEKCVGTDAQSVARYIFEAFYSPEARARIHPPRKELAHLTSHQYVNTVADLIEAFRPSARPRPIHGLSAHYYSSHNFSGDKKVIERDDLRIDFQWGDSSPDEEKIKPEEFSIQWRGSLYAPETGMYQFELATENGAKFFINDMREPLIDSWVSSAMLKEDAQRIFLLGGRYYPIRVDYFKFKDKSASIELRWVPPGYAGGVVPTKNLYTDSVGSTFVLSTAFPPDDHSMGYERGTAVSKSWVHATTLAAVEVAQHISNQIQKFARTNDKDPEFRLRIRAFLEDFVSLAFVSRLTESEKEFFVNRFVPDEWVGVESGVKKCVVLALKSPRFLYPVIGSGAAGDFAAARQLALGFWDSLPDSSLLYAASTGELSSIDGIERQASRLMNDPRTRLKLQTFFHHWLKMDEADDVDKDPTKFPRFDEHLLSDLKKSLQLFVDDIVWGEDPDYRRLLLGNTIFANSRLADFYDLDRPASIPGEDFIPVVMAGEPRSGILTHPFLMTTFAYYGSSSPIHRGVFLTRNILGRFLKPPPMAIEFMDGRFDPHLTMREKVTELTSKENCMACHSTINPLGFSVENFDAVGRFQTHDKQKLIDTVSDFLDIDGESIRLAGGPDVGEYAAANRLAQLGFIDQMFHHLTKNPAAAYGPETRRQLLDYFRENHFDIRLLVKKIVTIAAWDAQNAGAP